MSIHDPDEPLISSVSGSGNNQEYNGNGERVLAETRTLEQTFEDLDNVAPETETYSASIAPSQASRNKSTTRRKARYFKRHKMDQYFSDC